MILTSDHSSYAEPPTVEAFAGSPNYTDNFIDEIPFMIRIPGVEQAARYENGIRTSIDLAPTVLHLMGLSDVDHAFVGTSVFDPSVQPERNVAATGQDIYRIDSNGVTYITDETEIPEDEILIDTVYHYYQLEVENRVFGDSQTAAEATD